MFSLSNTFLDSCTAEHMSSLQPIPKPSNFDSPGISVTLQKDSRNIKILPENANYSRSEAGSSLICSSQLELNPSKDTGPSFTRRYPSPASSSCGHHDWNLNSGHQAKRARVENIIQGMNISPVMHCTDVETNQRKESDGMHENERIPELPLHQGRSGSFGMGPSQITRKRLEREYQHFRESRTRFNHVDVVTHTKNSSKREKYSTCNNPSETSPRDRSAESYREFDSGASRKYQGWKKVKLMNYVQSKPERIKLMADVLKYELSRAVSRSVDSIFKSMSLLHTSPNDEANVKTGVPLHSPVCDDKLKFSCCGNAEVQVPDVQTEAMSLVVQKPAVERANRLVPQSRSRDHHHSKTPIPFSYESALQEDQLPGKNYNTARQDTLRCFQDAYSEVSQAKFEKFNTHWNSVKVRSKVNSRSVRRPQTCTVSVDPMILQSLCLPHVKIETESLVKNNLYMLNEGLTTNHLKKAKLMFFYTRYPSSLVLKMCFHDVKFTRCITSQLIKWFSNFREFYYIQMEKFARHAFTEGVADARTLTVGRESELFRALNMHYNKANDFQVPGRFLEVAEITLREFYIAISVGKDRDPSWKKAIYKSTVPMPGFDPKDEQHKFIKDNWGANKITWKVLEQEIHTFGQIDTQFMLCQLKELNVERFFRM